MKENPTIKLLRIIGSPFVTRRTLTEPEESTELFDYAFKNRVGLLYLIALKNSGQLKQLQPQYEQLKYRCKETFVTAERVARILNEANIEYVIYKTIRPYPATPNDTDIIFLGPDGAYTEALNLLKNGGYIELGQAPLQVLFSDPIGVQIARWDKSGGIYYVDFYKEAGVDYFVYLSKNELKKNIISMELAGYNGVKVLTPEADLASILTHSVFPEMSYGLEVFYTTLYYFKEWNKDHFERFFNFVRSNHIILPVRANLTVTAILHKEAFNNIPEKLLEILDRLGGSYFPEIKRIKENGFKTPHKFSFATFFKTLLYKLVEPTALKSLGVQAIHMLNPVLTLDVFKTLHRMQKKDTYEQV